MRIVSGIYGGRRLAEPKGRDIRPTSDKVRGAVFNALASRMDLEGAQVLDVFCGTGALGLEALSRGAAGCTFIDSSRTSLDLARENAQGLGASGADFLLKDAAKLGARTSAGGGPADLAFLDPPYHLGLAALALAALHEGGWLLPGAMCVLEVEKDFAAVLPPFYVLINEKTYGQTRIFFLRYSQPE